MSVKVRILGDDSDLTSKLASSGKAMAKWGAAAAASALAAGAAMTKAGMDIIDANAKMARTLGGTIKSLQALQMAAGDTGLDGLESSLSRLNRRLGAAEIGAGAAAKTVEILGLDLEALSKMDTDQKLSSISDAIRSSGVSSQQAARHLQNLGFEQSQALEFFMEGVPAVGKYKDEIDKLGLAISEIDAAQVEAAGDAMAVFKDAAQASAQQMAVQFAPILGAVSDLFQEAAMEAGGFGQIAENVFDATIKGAGLAGDAIRGIQVIVKGLEVAFHGFSVVINTILAAIPASVDWVVNSARSSINGLIDSLNRLPGIDLKPMEIGASRATQIMQGVADQAKASMQDSLGELHDLMMQPLPSDQLETWVKDVKVAAEAAARETIAAREALNMPGLPMDDEEDDEAAQLAAQKAQEELDKLTAKMEARLEVIRQGFMDEDELAQLKYEQDLADLEQAHDLLILEKQEFDDLRKQLEEKFNAESEQRTQDRIDAELAMEQAAQAAKMNMYSQGLGNLAALMNTESRRLFAIGKVAAISQAVVDGYSSVMSSFAAGSKIGGPIVGAAFAATAAVATGVQIAKLSSVSYGSNSKPSAPPASEPQVPQQQQQQQGGGGSSSTLFVEGIDPSAMFSGEVMRNFAQKLIEFQQDGGQVVLT